MDTRCRWCTRCLDTAALVCLTRDPMFFRNGILCTKCAEHKEDDDGYGNSAPVEGDV